MTNRLVDVVKRLHIIIHQIRIVAIGTPAIGNYSRPWQNISQSIFETNYNYKTIIKKTITIKLYNKKI